MADNLGAFSPKLDELMSAYRSLAEHVSVCQRASPEQLGRELDALKAESAGYERRLEAGTRSRARMAAGLCRAQLRYEQEVRSLARRRAGRRRQGIARGEHDAGGRVRHGLCGGGGAQRSRSRNSRAAVAAGR